MKKLKADIIDLVTYRGKMTEAQLQDAVMRHAALNNWRTYHTFDSRKSAEGFPDLVAVRGGELIFMEFKNATNKTSQAQDAWLEDLDAVHKCWAWLVRPNDLDDIIERLRR